jgi:cytochrome P450
VPHGDVPEMNVGDILDSRYDPVLVSEPDGQLVLTDGDLIREALFNPDLSRAFDKRTFAQGIENSIFRRSRLHEYEQVLFPAAVDDLLPALIDGGRADLLEIGEVLSVVLAARRAGIDHPPGDVGALRELVGYVLTFSQGSAILDTVGDADRVRAEVRAALRDFDQRFFSASCARREQLIARDGASASSAETDVLTLLLASRADPGLRLDRDLILRETATYLQAGTHTSGQTLVNMIDLFDPWARAHEGARDRLRADRLFAQRCVQETIRLRPTTPRIKRLAERQTQVGGTVIPAGSVLVLDVYQANTDQAVYGPDAAEFNPGRAIPPGHQPWGLSFGAGPHICIGRTVAAGLPDASGDPGQHLAGLVSYMAQAIARLGVEPDPERAAVRDNRTARWTRWSSYPVRFASLASAAEGAQAGRS